MLIMTRGNITRKKEGSKQKRILLIFKGVLFLKRRGLSCLLGKRDRKSGDQERHSACVNIQFSV